MPTTDGLRAAAERLRNFNWGACGTDHCSDETYAAMETIVRHCLATPPAPTDERLVEIEAAANAATPGPWRVHDYRQDPAAEDWYGVIQGAFEIDGREHQIGQFRFSALPPGENKANALFIALSRTAVPELLAAIRDRDRQLVESRAEIERLRCAIWNAATQIAVSNDKHAESPASAEAHLREAAASLRMACDRPLESQYRFDVWEWLRRHDELEQEVERLREDAEQYRWFREMKQEKKEQTHE